MLEELEQPSRGGVGGTQNSRHGKTADTGVSAGVDVPNGGAGVSVGVGEDEQPYVQLNNVTARWEGVSTNTSIYRLVYVCLSHIQIHT